MHIHIGTRAVATHEARAVLSVRTHLRAGAQEGIPTREECRQIYEERQSGIALSDCMDAAWHAWGRCNAIALP